MADTFTPHYNLTKPQIGGDPDTWGDLLNANFDLIDAGIFDAKTVASNALPKAGGVLSGSLIITTPAASSAVLTLNKPASALAAQVLGQTAGVNRWQLNMGDNAAESGANAGSDFSLARHADGGAVIDFPLGISRATGLATFSQRPKFAAATPWDSANLNPGLYALLSGAAFTGDVTTPGLIRTDSSSTNALWVNNGNMRITNAGASKYFRAQSGGTGTLEIVNSAYTAVISNLTDAGVWSAVDFVALSDPRLKDEIAPLLRGLDELKRMRPREYVKYDNEDFLGEGKPEIGFLADEVEEVVPEALGEFRGYRTVSYGQLTALLASAILELDRRLTLAGV